MKRGIFEFTLHESDTQAVGEWRVYFECFESDAFAFVFFRVAVECADVMQSVRQANHNDADVFGCGDKEFAQTLGMAFHTAIFEFAEFGDAVDKEENVFAELALHLFCCHVSIFDGVVKKSCGDGCRVHVHARQGFCRFKYVEKVGFAGEARDTFMRLARRVIRLFDQYDIRLRRIGHEGENIADVGKRGGGGWYFLFDGCFFCV